MPLLLPDVHHCQTPPFIKSMLAMHLQLLAPKTGTSHPTFGALTICPGCTETACQALEFFFFQKLVCMCFVRATLRDVM